MSIKHKAPREDRMMKIFLRNPDGEIEGVWAEQVSRDTAIIWNIPSLTPGWGYGDLVRFDHEQIAVQRVLAQSETEILRYSTKGTPDQVTERYRTMATYFRGHGVEVEGMIAGYAGAARPIGMTETEFEALCDRSPIELLEDE